MDSPPPVPAAVSVLYDEERRYFRWRSEGVSRLENFSDVVFAFALTLLVVSTEVPRNFHALMGVLRDFPAFVASFYLLVTFWHNHYIFFRRYGLHDTATARINNVLLLMVLFCVYPLKYLFTLINAINSPWSEAAVSPAAKDALYQGVDVPVLMRLYAVALGSIFLLFALLYGRAWRLREVLQLNRAERLATLRKLTGFLITISVCCVSVLLTFSARTLDWAGPLYLLLIPGLMLNAFFFQRAIRRAVPGV